VGRAEPVGDRGGGLRRTMIRGAIGLVTVWLVLAGLAWGFQRQLIYLPDSSVPEQPGAPVESVQLTTDDGLELEAWLVPAEGQRHSTVLAAPGNAGNRALRLPLAEGLAERGHEVLLLEYRGYGGNPGRPHEDGLVEDARTARQWLVEEHGRSPDRLVHLGESIGTGVATALAAEHPPAAVALRSPFPELADVAATHYPFLPVRTLLRERFPSRAHLQAAGVPTLVVAGGQDSIVPTALSRELAEKVDATYVEVEGADHNDRVLLDGSTYLDAVDEFVRATLGPP
jgi:uncharacterized protein